MEVVLGIWPKGKISPFGDSEFDASVLCYFSGSGIANPGS